MSRTKNILVITYWGFNSSILQSYALPYIRLIKKNLSSNSKILLFTLTPRSRNATKDYLKAKEDFNKEGITLINFNYSPFGFIMGLKFIYIFFSLIFLTISNRINYIHAWCTPGGAIGYIVSIFTGKPLILDSFEPHAQSMVETKTWKKDGFMFKILFKLEKLQLKRAVNVICAAEGMIAYSQKVYGLVKPKYYVKPACVDLDLFSKKEKDLSLVKELGQSSRVCIYIGKFGDIYLSQEVFDFFKVASSYWGEKFKVLLLTNHSDEEVNSFCESSGLNNKVIIKLFVEHKFVPQYLSLADFGICPVKSVPTKEYCTPIKNAEYWAMGLPVVITKNISTDSALIHDNNIGYVLNELNNEEYTNAVKKIDSLLQDKTLENKIRKIAETHRNYSIAENIYHSIYS
ncbi:MAG: glycosyltransferase [Bacteroidetes bacterium]|nr:glycosyltransferase [Bacteroidota bacterium]